MMKERSLFRRAGIALTVTTVMLAAAIMSVQGSAPAPPPGDDGSKPRADIIRIDGLKQFGKLERPAVTYFHEKHTQALSKKNKDCATCHLPEKKYTSTKFKRLKDDSKKAVMDIYHDNCTTCHQQTAAASEKAGPVVCTGCHQERDVSSSWKEIGLDKSLHHRHVKAQENKCEFCHHQYDPAAKKLVYVKGKEDDCRYCHLDKTVDNVISMRLTAHTQCIDCHRKRLAQNQDAGPAFCGGCHDAGLQAKIQKLKDIPRLMRGQPDATIIQAVKSGGEKVEPFTRMSVVPFNHIGHETYNSTCRACHHSSMEACGKCHTLQGSKDGKFVNLQTAMHRVNAQASCLGCHDGFQAEKRCAGCHASMPRKDPPDLAGCVSCHMPKPAAATPQTEPKAMAAMLLEARKPVTATFADEDIPETVEIKGLSKQYEPAKLPHRKIVQTLVKNLKDNKLAGYFHRDAGTVCQGCHHNSPLSKKPPACASCHGQPFDGRNLFKPGLQAAYHLHCMECHKDMGIEKPVATNCTGCHKEKL
jgi:cytochrome c553